MFYILYFEINKVKSWMGSILLLGLRDQNFGENRAQGSKGRQENRDQWAPDIPCYDPKQAFLRAPFVNIYLKLHVWHLHLNSYDNAGMLRQNNVHLLFCKPS